MVRMVLLSLVVIAGCSKKDEAPAKDVPAPEPAPAEPEKQAPEEPPEPETLPGQADIQHGQVYWAVYLGAAPGKSPELEEIRGRAKALSIEVFDKDPGCDVPAEGVAEPPKLEGMLLAAYYDSEADARKVAERLGEPKPWVGQVKTMCLD